MTSTIVQPNTYGLDAASFHAVTNFAPVRDAGAQWVSFYIGGTYGVSARNLEGAWAAGLPVMPNFERTANAGLGGYTTGQLHATTATTQLTALGFLGECPVIFSGVDFGPTAGQFPAIDNYHRAIVDTFAPHGWTGGAYGPRSYLQHLAGQDFWPDWPLWHWGGDGFTVYDWAWCKQWYGYDQTPIKSQTLGYAVDENTLFKPMKFWAGYGADTDPPPEEIITPVPVEEHHMANFIGCVTLTPSGGAGALVFGSDGQYYRYGHHPGGVYYAFPRGSIGDNEYNALPEWNAANDAYWLADRTKERLPNIDAVGGGGGGASPEANADEFARRLARDA